MKNPDSGSNVPEADGSLVSFTKSLTGTNCSFPSDDRFRRIEQTVRFMNENLDRPLQAPRLAAMANISLSHYFALFKRCTGCAPIDFFIRLRMRRARQLLETTSLNIKEIAAALGYEDPFYFSRVFKSVNGMAPSNYRFSQRNANAKVESSDRLQKTESLAVPQL